MSCTAPVVGACAAGGSAGGAQEIPSARAPTRMGVVRGLKITSTRAASETAAPATMARMQASRKRSRGQQQSDSGPQHGASLLRVSSYSRPFVSLAERSASRLQSKIPA